MWSESLIASSKPILNLKRGTMPLVQCRPESIKRHFHHVFKRKSYYETDKRAGEMRWAIYSPFHTKYRWNSRPMFLVMALLEFYKCNNPNTAEGRIVFYAEFHRIKNALRLSSERHTSVSLSSESVLKEGARGARYIELLSLAPLTNENKNRPRRVRM